jgi:RNA polymerase sigma factor (TIGR02999 family)
MTGSDSDSAQRDVTQLLQAWRQGDAAALNSLMPLVYRELHTIAARYLSRERRGHTLQSTALVNEAFMRLVGQQRVDWQNRAHFFGIAASQMRRILVDHARKTHADKRGGANTPLPLDDATDAPAPAFGPGLVDALALDRALKELETLDPIQGRVVELRFFGGLTVEEAAEVLDISPTTVKREWTMAKAWLLRALEQGYRPSVPPGGADP